MGVTIPTKGRKMTNAEYAMLYNVFGSTLPSSWRIFITNGAGLNGRPFTIPSSLLSTLGATIAAGFLGFAAGYLSSAVNLAYFINVGRQYQGSMNLGSQDDKNLLVHETTHVWQGHNSNLALSYVFNSCISQCLRGGAAYNYQAGQDWHSYNVEQQASIVEDWFNSGSPRSGDLSGYIENYVKQGKA